MVSWVRSAQNRTLLFSYEHPANNLLFARDCSFFVTLGAFCFVDCISDTPNQPSFNRFSHKTPGFCSGFPDLNELKLRFSSRMCGCMGDVLSSAIFCSSFTVCPLRSRWPRCRSFIAGFTRNADSTGQLVLLRRYFAAAIVGRRARCAERKPSHRRICAPAIASDLRLQLDASRR
jgi:hypothetical protein